MNILIVEDEAPIREVEVAYLRRAGYAVAEAADGQVALEQLKKRHFDALLLDLNLPETSGIEICRQIREDGSTMPIMMVTAKVEDTDELAGLDAGADDYIKKPFNPQVLVARMEALLRRNIDGRWEMGDGKKMIGGGLVLDGGKMVVEINGQETHLTTTQFNLLSTLSARPGVVYTREQLMEAMYPEGTERDIFDRTIDAHVKSLRKLIEEDSAHPKLIKTVVGRGYVFDAESP